MKKEPNILVVDDTNSNIISLKASLESLNVRILEANSGKEALKVCSHSVENTTSFKLDPDGSDA